VGDQKHYFLKKVMQAFVIRLAPQSSSSAANHASATTTVVAAAADKKKMGCCSLLPPPPPATALYISSYHHHSLLPIRNLATPFLSVNLRDLLLEVKRNNKASSSSSSQRCRHHCCVYGNFSQGAVVVDDGVPVARSIVTSHSMEEEMAPPPPRSVGRVLLRTKRKKQPPTQKVFTNLEKLDKCGRLRTPRAARELALSVLYAAFVSGVHPLRVFDDRTKQRAVGFDKSLLQGYEHSPDVEENVIVENEAMASALEEAQESEASLEAIVLIAPPPLVYNNFVIRLARSLVKETANRWLPQEAILMEILPAKWKIAPKGAVLQICILQMALAELESTGTPPNVVVNEAVELAKRFCDLAAPRIINGCLGSYTRRRQFQAKSRAEKIQKEELELPLDTLQPEDLGWNETYHD